MKKRHPVLYPIACYAPLALLFLLIAFAASCGPPASCEDRCLWQCSGRGIGECYDTCAKACNKPEPKPALVDGGTDALVESVAPGK